MKVSPFDLSYRIRNEFLKSLKYEQGASFSVYIVDHRACTTKRGRTTLARFPCTFTRLSTLVVARRSTLGKHDEERRRIE